MSVALVLSAVPSVAVAYMMICRLNAKKRAWYSVEGWSYLFFLGGSMFTFYTLFSHGILPSMGKMMLDLGIFLYFVQINWRTYKWQHRRPSEKSDGLFSYRGRK